jgi:hypothetical protein
MRGRPPKPLALLQLSGAVKKNPQRYRERAAEAADTRGVGDPPEEFLHAHSPSAVAHLAIWHRLLEDAPPGCIMRRHRTALMNACKLQAQIDRGGKVSPAMHAQMYRYLTGFGMTGESRLPEGRKDVPPPGESEESGWQAFAKEDKAARRG